jgi:hypothetical protein
MGEKRGESRTVLMARVDVLWADGENAPRVAPATLEDKSGGGYSVRLKESIPVGTHITVKRGGEQISGTVTYCRPDKGNFVIGVKREAVAKEERKS